MLSWTLICLYMSGECKALNFVFRQARVSVFEQGLSEEAVGHQCVLDRAGL